VLVVVVLLLASAALWVLSITLAPEGRDVAGRFVGLAGTALVAAALVGTVDFFVRHGAPQRSGPSDSTVARSAANE